MIQVRGQAPCVTKGSSFRSFPMFRGIVYHNRQRKATQLFDFALLRFPCLVARQLPCKSATPFATPFSGYENHLQSVKANRWKGNGLICSEPLISSRCIQRKNDRGFPVWLPYQRQIKLGYTFDFIYLMRKHDSFQINHQVIYRRKFLHFQSLHQ